MATATAQLAPPASYATSTPRALAGVPRGAVVTFGLALCAVPVSIAIAETFLAAALLLRLTALIQHGTQIQLPRIFWFWSVWAAMEAAAWLRSADIGAGLGEMRHLLLIAAMFLAIATLDKAHQAVTIWRGIFLAATLGSLVLIADFLYRMVHFRREISASADPSFYLRSGGLLHHWMIYGTVEVLVFAALLEYWRVYPEHRRYLIPVFGVQGVAIFLSLTRMLWVCCLLLLILQLAARRSKWIFTVPLWPVLLFVLAPQPIRSRVVESLQPNYYSNAERVQMLGVGFEMVRDHPLAGVGPGRVEGLYRSYLSPHDPVPAYHGHLHNNLVQLAAQFGLPVALTAVLFVALLFKHLHDRSRAAVGRENQFVCRIAWMGLVGFLTAGMFDYTYGHSLGLILLGFVVLAPDVVDEPAHATVRPMPTLRALALLDRAAGALLFAVSLVIIIPAAAVIRILSRRTPFIAHLRIGKNGCSFWVWKLRTMWPRAQAPRSSETGWVERIQRDPQTETKPANDPRITSRFARFCRRHSIDELPQFLHVMRGQMSLVGPRPLTRGELNRYYGAKAQEILTFKPGLTGYWQTRGRNRLSYSERVALDLQLVRELSTQVYFQVLLRTIPQVVLGTNAW